MMLRWSWLMNDDVFPLLNGKLIGLTSFLMLKPSVGAPREFFQQPVFVKACTGVYVVVIVVGFLRKEGTERKDAMPRNVSIYNSKNGSFGCSGGHQGQGRCAATTTRLLGLLRRQWAADNRPSGLHGGFARSSTWCGCGSASVCMFCAMSLCATHSGTSGAAALGLSSSSLSPEQAMASCFGNNSPFRSAFLWDTDDGVGPKDWGRWCDELHRVPRR